jgi:hypothetical protein
MRTTQTKATRDLGQLAEDVAAANALRASWRRGGKRHTNDGACSCDDCGAQPAQPGEPSALINTAWLDDLAATLRAHARELDEWVAGNPNEGEWSEAYRHLAHALRVDAVMAQRQREEEWGVMRDAVSRIRLATPLALVQ